MAALRLLCMLAVSIYFVTSNWSTGFLAGHEFRQAHTALSIAFIDREQNFSIAYPTPLFGPPWTAPVEFPLLPVGGRQGDDLDQLDRPRKCPCRFHRVLLPQLARHFGAHSHFPSHGLPCSVDRVKLHPTSPVFIYYTRSILIESTALMFSVWFLLAFVQMCRHSSWTWMTIAALLGAGAALVKITTFMAWCGGAACGGIWWSVQQWRTSWMGRVAPVCHARRGPRSPSWHCRSMVGSYR